MVLERGIEEHKLYEGGNEKTGSIRKEEGGQYRRKKRKGGTNNTKDV